MEDEMYKVESTCLKLYHDEDGGKIEIVTFKRDEDGGGDIDAAAARLLGIAGDRVRCFSIPGAWDCKMNMALHLYIDLEAVEHKMAHNTNASQLWLAAHLPLEPPEVSPSSISGPVLITADDIKTEEFVDLTKEHWEKLKALAKEVCESAIFMA